MVRNNVFTFSMEMYQISPFEFLVIDEKKFKRFSTFDYKTVRPKSKPSIKNKK